MNYRHKNLTANLNRVLANVSENIRKNHLLATNIGRRSRGQKLLLRVQKPVKVPPTVTPETDEDQDEDNLDNP